ncbi:OmpA/MotB domain protein [Brucella melitensis NI]|nr:OmpA/MotB domain protein [Brucella melitensis NI]
MLTALSVAAAGAGVVAAPAPDRAVEANKAAARTEAIIFMENNSR